jgi:hypothetical protein
VNCAVPATATGSAVDADIEFLVPRPGRPFAYGYDPEPDAPPPSTEFEARRVRIRDVRRAGALSLEANGATLIQCPTRVRNFYDDDELQGRYYGEAAELIRATLGARRVVVYDHNVRRGSRLALKVDRYDQGRPVHHAHTDYTAASAARRLEDELGAEARALAHGRYLQVNLWRPIRAPLRDAPLAICDGATVTADSLRTVDLRYPGRCGEIYYLAHDDAQRWYYASDMGTDEAWLFKNFDSAPTGPARAAPHSAFEDTRRHPHVPPRESIEVRAFAFLDA